MVHIIAMTKDNEILKDIQLSELENHSLNWYWVDFDSPTDDEVELLASYFKFHPLSIEDCLYFLQRPKIDFYDSYTFFVLNSLNHETLNPEEIDIFLGSNYIVSFHKDSSEEIIKVWKELLDKKEVIKQGCAYIFHLILDNIVDKYFPLANEVEDEIEYLSTTELRSKDLIDKIFQIRNKLVKLRRVINSMRDLLYRILNSDHLKSLKDKKIYFNDIHDHLLKLSEMIESSRDLTSDIRDNYISINSDIMNKRMMIFTVVTSIFIPLTFITGIYGMNFTYMPELNLRYGYYGVLGLMVLIGASLILFFKKKDWFNL